MEFKRDRRNCFNTIRYDMLYYSYHSNFISINNCNNISKFFKFSNKYNQNNRSLVICIHILRLIFIQHIIYVYIYITLL